MTVKRMADLFRAQPEALPSDLVPEDEARAMAERVVALLREKGVERFGVRVHRAGEYPAKLREARHPVEVLTFQGWWSYVEQRSVAVVGTRKASEEGRRGVMGPSRRRRVPAGFVARWLWRCEEGEVVLYECCGLR